MGIVEDYLAYTRKWKAEYGDKTLVLMQVGSFFEVYGLRAEDGTISGSNIEDFSRLCDMAVSAKAQKIKSSQVMMAGFGLAQIDKYLRKLQQAGYTIPIYVQDIQAKNTTRSLSEIVSPGTFFDDESQSLSNVTMCVWLHRAPQTRYSPSLMHIGVATTDSMTGKSVVSEFSRKYYRDSSTFDDLERVVSITRPYECVIVSNLDSEYVEEVVGFVGLSNSLVHIVDKRADTDTAKHAQNAEKQVYQHALMTRFFSSASPELVVETFRTHEFSMQAFTMLVDFIHQHRPVLLSKISFPELEHGTGRLLLANHSLRQLNIIDDGRHTGKQSSVASLLNNCVTPMGQRSFRHTITSPVTDVGRLESSYDLTEYCLQEGAWEMIRNGLTGIRDMERFVRKLALRRASPKDVITFYDGVAATAGVFTSLRELGGIESALEAEHINCIDACEDVMITITNCLDIDKSRALDDISADKLGTLTPEDACFIVGGKSDVVDSLLQESSSSSANFEAIREFLSSLVGTIEKSTKTKDFIKIHETAKSDPMLVCTKRRATLLDSAAKKAHGKAKFTSFNTPNGSVELDIGSITAETMGANKKDVVITSPMITSLAKSIQLSREKLITELNDVYNAFVDELLAMHDGIQRIIAFVAWADELQNRCYCASKFNYCKPRVVAGAPKAFVDATGLRHPLIEQLQTRELYVTNDLGLGDTIDGLLLYGTNAVGKTSLIRALGISVVLAQAGMYVPCESFSFKPYTKIFTRILGNDNLFKGLSTFAVEMSELRTILTMCDKDSLVMGDELCSGTESDSARSIFTAGLEWLHDTHTSFIFATHFHEVQDYAEITALGRLVMKHMAVTYDEKTGKLVYDRKLREGPGANMYGLEVCKALNLPDKFLARAHTIRVRYDPTSSSVLGSKGSRYNARKLKGACEVCGNAGNEVHHLKHQADADAQGFVGSAHKNHPANLLNVCEKCHDKLHLSGKRHRVAKTSAGYELVEE